MNERDLCEPLQIQAIADTYIFILMARPSSEEAMVPRIQSADSNGLYLARAEDCVLATISQKY
jgi:hypothetical protein